MKVYLSPTLLGESYASWDDLPLIGTITTAGVHVLMTRWPRPPTAFRGTSSSSMNFPAPSTNRHGTRFLQQHLRQKRDGRERGRSRRVSACVFSLFTINSLTENGRFLRKNAVMTTATFRYDVYDALFADRRTTIGDAEYDRVLQENEGMEDSIVPDPNNPDGWLFGEGFPIVSVVSVEVISLPGTGYHGDQLRRHAGRILRARI
ncbi:MAG: hypothetical protein MZU79_01475 [Anaerotruncus sp.]|nr:hypothetical protein [Anaerotruncus sp.]